MGVDPKRPRFSFRKEPTWIFDFVQCNCTRIRSPSQQLSIRRLSSASGAREVLLSHRLMCDGYVVFLQSAKSRCLPWPLFSSPQTDAGVPQINTRPRHVFSLGAATELGCFGTTTCVIDKSTAIGEAGPSRAPASSVERCGQYPPMAS